MKANSSLQLEKDMKVNIVIEMSIQEIQETIEILKQTKAWPICDLSRILTETLEKFQCRFFAESKAK